MCMMWLRGTGALLCLMISQTFCQDFAPIDIIMKHFMDDLLRNLTSELNECTERWEKFMGDQKLANSEIVEKLAGMETEVAKLQEDVALSKSYVTGEFGELKAEISRLQEDATLFTNQSSKEFGELNAEMARLQEDVTSLTNHSSKEIIGKISTLGNDLLRNLSTGIATVQESCSSKKEEILSVEAKTCPSGWEQLQNSCYHVSEETGPWLQGVNYCRRHDADYVKITSETEWQFVNNLHTEVVFIGLNDIGEKGVYSWNSDSSIAAYTNWKPGEPSDSYGILDCVIALPDGYWYSTFCKNIYRFMCEKIIG